MIAKECCPKCGSDDIEYREMTSFYENDDRVKLEYECVCCKCDTNFIMTTVYQAIQRDFEVDE